MSFPKEKTVSAYNSPNKHEKDKDIIHNILKSNISKFQNKNIDFIQTLLRFVNQDTYATNTNTKQSKFIKEIDKIVFCIRNTKS